VSGLQRLIITFKPDVLVVHALCRTQDALEALKSGVEVLGTSGFTMREDVLLATTSPDAAKIVKRA